MIAPLLVILVAVAAGVDFFGVEGPWTFNSYGLSQGAVLILVLVAAGFLVERLLRQPFAPRGGFIVMLLAALPLIWLLRRLGLWRMWQQGVETFALEAAFVLWIGFVAWRLLSRIYGLRDGKEVGGAVIMAGAASLTLLVLPYQVAFHQAYDAAGSEGRTPPINVEQVYYSQPGMVDAAVAGLAPQRPGVVDLYFLGVAGYADEAVFLHEVEAAQALFDERFDTAGRSLLLANHSDSLMRLPLANGHNLAATLRGLAKVMDRDEDILFLYLTSHGSADHFLSLKFWPFRLNDMGAETLKGLLDETNIKHEIVLVSACYSGGFIEPLKSQSNLIMTAARADRTSFGCGHDGDWTYFGRAYFGEALRETGSFVDAFEAAKLRVDARERAQGFTPSEPQIHIGKDIEGPLAILTQRLR